MYSSQGCLSFAAGCFSVCDRNAARIGVAHSSADRAARSASTQMHDAAKAALHVNMCSALSSDDLSSDVLGGEDLPSLSLSAQRRGKVALSRFSGVVIVELHHQESHKKVARQCRPDLDPGLCAHFVLGFGKGNVPMPLSCCDPILFGCQRVLGSKEMLISLDVNNGDNDGELVSRR